MSIKKIAEQAGVSVATVSRVLNNPDYRCSSPEVEDKIWKAVMEQNYVPNEAARNLKMGISAVDRTYYINVLITRMDASLSDPFFTELLRLVENQIHKSMHILSKVWYMPVFSDIRKQQKTDFDKLIQEMYSEVRDKNDGLVIIGKCNRQALKKLKAFCKNIVSVNRNSTNYEIDEVLCDGGKIASLAVEYLVQLGHQKIGYVGERKNEARFNGYMKTLKKYGIAWLPEHVMEIRQTEAEGFECMERILQMENAPTGLYVANDITAIGMLKCLNRYKKIQKIPSIIASDDIEQAQSSKPMLTTVRLPKDEMAKFAVALLLDRIQGGHKSVVRTELEGKLMIRESCTAWQRLDL